MCLFRRLFIILSLSFIGNSIIAQEEVLQEDVVSIKAELERLLLVYSDSGNVNSVKYLLDHGVDPNAKSEQGVTALMYASQAGYYNIVELLLQYKADPNIAPYDGNSALHAAVRSGNDSIAELLIQYKANVNASNNQGLTPLHYSVWYGFPYLTDILLYYGAKIDVKDLYGYTPLLLSVYSGAYLSSKLLLEQGANPNLCNEKGVSPLMVAAQYNDTSLANLLLNYEADVNLLDDRQTNALAYAISNNSKEMVVLLKDYGAFDQRLSKSYYQIAAETEFENMRVYIDSIGLKTKLKPSLGNVCIGTGTIFSNHEFMWGFSLGIAEQITKLNFNIEYWFRPSPIATLRYGSNGYYQYREKRQVVGLRVDRFFKIRTFPSGKSFGTYLGGSLDFVFRDFRGTSSDPKTSLYPGLNAGLFWGGENTKLLVGWEFTGLRTPEATPHRFGVHLYFSFPVGKSRVVNTVISHVD